MTADTHAVPGLRAMPEEVVLWWGSACRSVLPLFEEVAALLETRVVVETSLSECRRRLGWKQDEAPGLALHRLSETGWRREIERLLEALARDLGLLARPRQRAVGYRQWIAPRVAACRAVEVARLALLGQGRRPVPPWFGTVGDGSR